MRQLFASAGGILRASHSPSRLSTSKSPAEPDKAHSGELRTQCLIRDLPGRTPLGSGELTPKADLYDVSDNVSFCSDKASHADDLSLPSSPGGSIDSCSGSPLAQDPDYPRCTPPRRSFDQSAPKPPTHTQNRNERSNFLQSPVSSPSLSPDGGPWQASRVPSSSPLLGIQDAAAVAEDTGSPLCDLFRQVRPPSKSPCSAAPQWCTSQVLPGPAQAAGLTARVESPPKGTHPPSSGNSALGDSRPTSPLYASSSSSQADGGRQGRGGGAGAASCSAASSNSSRLPCLSLREQVLLRSSNGRSGELVATDVFGNEEVEGQVEAEDVAAQCLNFDDVEALCQEKELDKDIVNGVAIVLLPSMMAGDTEQYVVYALYFSSQGSTPVLPGDDSIKLLFPEKLQLQAAVGKGLGSVMGRAHHEKRNVTDCKPSFASCGPFGVPPQGEIPKPVFSMFGSFKPCSDMHC